MTIDGAIQVLLSARLMFGGETHVTFNGHKSIELTDADSKNKKTVPIAEIAYSPEFEDPGTFNYRN